jgi:hypothetical protein
LRRIKWLLLWTHTAAMGLLDRLIDRLQDAMHAPQTPRSWRCLCGAQLYFRNSRCLACSRELGYDPQRLALVNVQQAPGLQRCANLPRMGCNWLLPASEAALHEGLCRSCRLNRTVPNWDEPANALAWGRIELAKRRLVSQLLALGLPVRSRVSEDPQQGLMFDFLQALPDQPVTTGHAQGLITLNVEEADDARREQIRQALREPYRTVLGHLRHEIGHYYWDRLVRDTPWLARVRARFGDERADYGEALKRHYANGPAADWPQRCISAYASSHPWEDWAETFAHYLHMIDTVDTALSFGLTADDVEFSIQPFGLDALDADDDARRFLRLISGWLELVAVLNELSRSMGQPDFYPFVIGREAVAKLHLVHRIIIAV